MIILLYGKDTYRSREKLEEIIAGYRKKYGSGLNIRFFDASCSFSDLCDEERQHTMFDEKRLLIVREALSSSLKDDFLKNPEKLLSTENIIVFYEEKEIDLKDKFLLLLKEKEGSGVMQQEFCPLSGKKLFKWIEKEFIKNGVSATEETIYSLVSFRGENLWLIKNEIDKLSLFAGKGNEVDKNTAYRLMERKITANIFHTIDALAEGEKEKAANLLCEHLQKGDNPLYLFSMFGYQFRNLIVVRDLIDRGYSYEEIGRISGLRPFVLRKNYNQVRRFTSEKLQSIYSSLFRFDLQIKTGQIDPALALYLLLFQS